MKTNGYKPQSNSKRLGTVLCRFHNEDTPSLSLYENYMPNGVVYYTYYCFGCSASGRVEPGQVAPWLSDVVRLAPDKPKPHINDYWPHSVSVVDEECNYIEDTRDFLQQRNISPYLASISMRYHMGVDALVWKCLTEDGVVQGAQLRFLDPQTKHSFVYSERKKVKILHLEVPKPVAYLPRYAVIPCMGGVHRLLILSESYCDGLALASHVPHDTNIMTTLSTGFNQQHIGVVHRVASRCGAERIVLAFDIDLAGLKAEKQFSRYLSALGYEVVCMSKRFEGTEPATTPKPYHMGYITEVQEVLKK